MPTEIVSVIGLGEIPRLVLEDAVRVLNVAQDRFDVRLNPRVCRLPEPDVEDSYSWDLLGSMLAQERHHAPTDYLFGILDRPIELNWFSKSLHEERACFITIDGWAYQSDIPVVAYIAYQIVENLLEILEQDMSFHEETRGCIHDLCAFKPHISFKMRTADICSDCLSRIRTVCDEPTIAAIIAMIEAVRRVALGRGDARVSNTGSLAETVDQLFPFPIAHSFRAMQSEITPMRKWMRLVDLWEVIIRYLALLMIAGLQEHPRLPEIKRHLGLTNLRRPTSGNWHGTCFAGLESATNFLSDSVLQRWVADLSPGSVEEAKSASAVLLDLRNTYRGHGCVVGDARYHDLYEANVRLTEPLLRIVQPLTSYILLKPTGEVEQRKGQVRFAAKHLVGSHPVFPVGTHAVAGTVDTDCLLFDPVTNRFLSVYPWIMLEPCPTCHREMVFMYEKLEGGAVLLQEFPAEHTQKRQDLSHDVLRVLDR